MLALVESPDDVLELRIEAARKALEASQGLEDRAKHWRALASLIAQRSAAQVERMERKRGIA